MTRSDASGRSPGFTLVLGGGGSTGLAFMCGALRAMRDVAGLDPADADLMIGTSAGSVMAADLRLGRSLDETFEQVRPGSDANHQIGRAWRSYPDLARRLVGSTWVMTRTALPLTLRMPQPPQLLQRAFPGSLLVMAGNERWANDRYRSPWPARPLWIVTTELDSRRRVILDGRHGGAGIPMAEAVRASCAVPGLYPPVRVGARRLVDGGVASVANVDLAAQGPSGLVIALAPMGFDPRQPPARLRSNVRRQFNVQLERESRTVRRSGKRLLLVRPTGAELKLHGVNILDSASNDRIEEAAFEATSARLADRFVGDLVRRAAAEAADRRSDTEAGRGEAPVAVLRPGRPGGRARGRVALR